MNIFYVSEIEQNNGWGTECSIDKSLNLLGHRTQCLDYRKNKNRLYKRFRDAQECQVFLLQRGAYFPLRLLKNIHVPKFFWASEISAKDQDRLLRSDLFDHIFMRTNEWIDRAVGFGWVRKDECSVLLSGFDENLHRPTDSILRNIDVLFVGYISPRRKKILDEISRHYKVTVASAFGEEMVNYVNRAKIVLNIHVSDVTDTETRVFEVLGCKRFLLTEKLSPENPFSESELVQYEGLTDLLDKIGYYLRHDDEREQIAQNGHRTAINNHTYTHRAKEIVDVMSRYVKEECRMPVRKDWAFQLYGLSEPAFWAGGKVIDSVRWSAFKAYQLKQRLLP